MNGIERVIANYEKLSDLLKRKNAGYSGHREDDVWVNFREWEPVVPAHLAALSRAGDKWNRVKALLQNPSNDQVHEPVEEAMDDMTNYLQIARDLYLEWKAAAPVDNDEMAQEYSTGYTGGSDEEVTSH
jgi:hypothetical protein